MAANVIIGKNYYLKSGTINFYGAMGRSLTNDYWLINQEIDSTWMNKKEATDEILQAILECITADTNAGKRYKIAYVIVDRRAAVSLYLSKVITTQHLRNAREYDDCIDIPDVTFDNLSLTVRVDKEVYTDYFCATADKKCVIID